MKCFRNKESEQKIFNNNTENMERENTVAVDSLEASRQSISFYINNALIQARIFCLKADAAVFIRIILLIKIYIHISLVQAIEKIRSGTEKKHQLILLIALDFIRNAKA